jgi:imidazolonepropionase-like amidohydrolase
LQGQILHHSFIKHPSLPDDPELFRIPPFRDAHMHFIREGIRVSSEGILSIIASYLRHGILSLSDMGHKTGIGLKAKKMSSGDMVIRSAGVALFKKGGYGAFLGKGVTGKKEIKEAVKEISEAGSDFIKVINSGIVSTRGKGGVTDGGFSPEELKVIREESRERNLDMVCHANTDVHIQDAVAAGASSIEHGFFVSSETLHMMAEKRVSWTPTVFALQCLASALPSPERRNLEGLVDNHLSSVHYAVSLGIPLRVGTDSGSKGVTHGESFFHELQLLQRAGLSFEQLLTAACMEKEEMARGNVLLIQKDFLSTGKIEAAYRQGTAQ